MDSRVLRLFAAVAEELHFGRAAERLRMAQPPLSQQIRKLEDELGARLFERSSRRVALTREGEALLEESRRVLADLDRAEERIRGMVRGERGRIGMGFVGPAMETELASLLLSFREKLPGLRLILEEGSSLEQLDKVRSGLLDVGHVRLFRRRPDGLTARLIWRERYVLALPPGHRLADLAAIRLSELDGESVLLSSRSALPELHDAFMDSLAAAGARVEASMEARRKETLLALTAAGAGVSIVPAAAMRSGRADVLFREIADNPLPEVELFQVWRPGAEFPALTRYLEHTAPLARAAGVSSDVWAG